jgi:hypothetical protein
MYARNKFERLPSYFLHANQNVDSPPCLFSYSCAHSRLQIPSFDILLQNAGGRGHCSIPILQAPSSGLSTLNFELSTLLHFHSLTHSMNSHTTPKPFLSLRLRTLHRKNGGYPFLSEFRCGRFLGYGNGGSIYCAAPCVTSSCASCHLRSRRVRGRILCCGVRVRRPGLRRSDPVGGNVSSRDARFCSYA